MLLSLLLHFSVVSQRTGITTYPPSLTYDRAKVKLGVPQEFLLDPLLFYVSADHLCGIGTISLKEP